MDAASGGTTISAEMAEEASEHDLLTLGVEEEYLLFDAVDPTPAEAVDDVVARVPVELRESVQHEFLLTQIEVASPPQLELADLFAAMRRLRHTVATAAEQAGVRLVAVGTGPTDGPPAGLADSPRYHRMIERYGDLTPGYGVCGTHVHVSIPDPETGVHVLNHLRPWLPALQAATANSPLVAGRDTGYASFRSMLWDRWPTVGPTPPLRSHAHYRETVAALVASGVMLDEGMLYWYARLSAHYPTVEIRMGDVMPTLDDAMLLAALARALVATLLRDVRAGVPAPEISPTLLAAAHWRAAHDGLEGLALDPVSGETGPAWSRLQRLFDLVRPELVRHGDLAMATVLMGRLRAHGTGAARQRAILARNGSVADVVDWLALATRGSGSPGPARG